MHKEVRSTINTFYIHKSGARIGMAAELRYSASDPYAVVLAFRQTAGWTEWFIDRDMLADGLFDEVGQGDVRIRPHHSGPEVVVIELHPPDGYAMLEMPGLGLAEFLERTYDIVMSGMEVVDVDEELKHLAHPD